MDELYKVYRPRNFDEIIGSAATVKAIEQKIEKGTLPHFILLDWPFRLWKNHCSPHY